MRRYQIFAWSGWTGYSVVNPTVSSTKSGGPVAACWATLQHIGRDGYLELVGKCQEAAGKIIAAVNDMPSLSVMGDPKINLFALTSDSIDLFALAEDMKAKGWYIQPQFGYSNSPANLHLSVGASNAPHVDEFIRDLSECEAALRTKPQASATAVPDDIGALLQSDGDAFAAISAATGIDPNNLPERMDDINNLLNRLPAPVRDKLMVEFVNRLYGNQ